MRVWLVLQVMSLGVDKELVLVASTGVIGQFLPLEKIESVMPRLVKSLSSGKGSDFATAIMTTDLKKKEAAVEVEKKWYTIYSGWLHKRFWNDSPQHGNHAGFYYNRCSNQCL